MKVFNPLNNKIMKKSCNYGLIRDIGLLKMIKIMRFTIFLLIISLSQAIAVNSYSQQTRLTLNLKGVTVEQVLDEVEMKTEFFFLYNKEMVDVDRKVDIDVDGKRINEVLDELFENSGVAYTIKDRQILLTNAIAGHIGSQQLKSITGKVTDDAGLPLPGVTVLVKGTTQGTITNPNGDYNLAEVKGQDVLVFSFVGMITQEVQVGSQSLINVTLLPDAIGIEEVVAIGYGTKSKATLTGAISTVGSESIEGRPTANATDLLQGIAPGLSISRGNSGRLRDRDVSINIRGLTSRSDPGVLIVIDGIPQKDNNALAIDNINPDDIENISVLKDAQAAIYGGKGCRWCYFDNHQKGKNR